MFCFSLCVCLLSTVEPVIIDSTIWQANLTDFSVCERTLSEMVIDYYIDDFLYVLTPRMLYKLDCDDLSILDRIPLPQRFNYMTTISTNIALITSDEIILINKRNLGYAAGIGIERADNRPLAAPEHFRPPSRDVLYLISDSGSKSTLIMLNVQTGEVSRRLALDKIVYCECDCLTQTISILDASHRITILDAFLNKKKTLTSDVRAHWFTARENGYLLGNDQGFFSIDGNGRVIDFLPTSIVHVRSTDKLVVINKQGVLICDPLTLRPQQYFEFDRYLIRLAVERADETKYAVVVDTSQTFYAIELQTAHIDTLTKKKETVPITIPFADRMDTDSLWYFQIGAFVTAENAQNSYNALRLRGLPVYIDTSELYRVKLGGFSSKAEAINLIESANLNGWFVFQEKIRQSERAEFHVGTATYMFEDGIIRRITP